MAQGYTSNIALPVTGTGSYVKSTSPTITTPNIIGVTDASNASAGSVGEYVSSTIAAGSAVSILNATSKTITSISLTAGDWDVWGELIITGAATTKFTSLIAGISTTNNTLTTFPTTSGSTTQLKGPIDNASATTFWRPGTNSTPIMPLSPCRINITSTTPVYLIANAEFTIDTASAYGKICARRAR